MPYGLDSNPETCTFSHGRCVSPGRTTLVGIPRWWNLQPSFAITDGESQSRLLAVADGVFTVILLEPKSDSSRQKYQVYVHPGARPRPYGVRALGRRRHFGNLQLLELLDAG